MTTTPSCTLLPLLGRFLVCGFLLVVLPVESFLVLQQSSQQSPAVFPTTKSVLLSSPWFSSNSNSQRRVDIRTATTALSLAEQSSNSEPSSKTTRDSSTPTTNTSMFRVVYEAIGSTTSIVVSGTFFIVLTWKRDAMMVSFFIGAISNGILSKVLKKILKQERPAELDATEMTLKPSDNGMPSSHAMSLGFIGTYTALILPWTRIPLLAYVILSLLYRIETNLHSRDQILAGLILGSLNGALWKMLCDGSNPWDINIMQVVSRYVLNDAGVLPLPLMAVPAIVGAMVVGSVERRISSWLNKKNDDKDD